MSNTYLLWRPIDVEIGGEPNGTLRIAHWLSSTGPTASVRQCCKAAAGAVGMSVSIAVAAVRAGGTRAMNALIVEEIADLGLGLKAGPYNRTRMAALITRPARYDEAIRQMRLPNICTGAGADGDAR